MRGNNARAAAYLRRALWSLKQAVGAETYLLFLWGCSTTAVCRRLAKRIRIH